MSSPSNAIGSLRRCSTIPMSDSGRASSAPKRSPTPTTATPRTATSTRCPPTPPWVSSGTSWPPASISPSSTSTRWTTRLFPGIRTIVVESKADVNYPIVSVASIVAKTLRHHRESAVQRARNRHRSQLRQRIPVHTGRERLVDAQSGSRVRIAVGGAIQLGPGREAQDEIHI
ncbi:uncharacterized protein ACA1_142180 [Acanthamoeba castellanii str. Neff]|uniref:Ribonuclease n=1 Tax=Acanthamoeba castellanii (strain ATCC 30010 / Neff) TaxID=1257118 RepID=L8HBA8_ACACF|nr:uncharacterized protein ACA1_142180 [Acanthamoeba castellanii str. Neff]ELR22527.1 hypothetical protein ACA1_142180 [Acanthamoeba castellanii str. Neff]